MCGIVGYTGEISDERLQALLLLGLERLEYRGYDSSGMAWVDLKGQLVVVKKAGKVAALKTALNGNGVHGHAGIAHTRWATNGKATDDNAHPHTDARVDQARIALVHNGIIDNMRELRTRLKRQGHVFSSETDTEVLAHLIGQFLEEGKTLTEAIQLMHQVVVGAYAILVLDKHEPDRIVAARNGSPLVVGITDTGYYVASDRVALVGFADRTLEVQDGELVVLRKGQSVDHRTMSDETVEREAVELKMGLEEIAKGGYAHFMLKEIMEQPEAIERTLAGRLTDGDNPRVHLGGIGVIQDFVTSQMEQIVILACGTSWHAGLIGQRMLQKLLRLPVRAEYASEFITGHTPVNDRTLVITISQSGETKDTIAAAKKAKKAGATLWNICNVVGSSLTKEAECGVFLHVGPEIGVASTKAFTAQVVALSLFGLKLVELRNPEWVTQEGRRQIAHALLALPGQIRQVLADNDHVREIAFQVSSRQPWLGRVLYRWSRQRTSWLSRLMLRLFGSVANALYLGRGYNYPTAMEGALKLKEISYVHAEGYPAGEMKHGPIALIDRKMPVVIIAPQEGERATTYPKVVSNLEEVASRHGRVILVASETDTTPEKLRQEGKVERILRIPKTLAMFTTVLASIHLQLLAYHIAEIKGCEIDQPRNLAKSVTVE